MRTIAILALAILAIIYTGYFDPELTVYGVRFQILASGLAATGLTYVLTMGRH